MSPIASSLRSLAPSSMTRPTTFVAMMSKWLPLRVAERSLGRRSSSRGRRVDSPNRLHHMPAPRRLVAPNLRPARLDVRQSDGAPGRIVS